MLTMAVQVNRAFGTSDVDVEECDDGNLIQFDGCDQHCLIEPAYRCTPNARGNTEEAPPATPAPTMQKNKKGFVTFVMLSASSSEIVG